MLMNMSRSVHLNGRSPATLGRTRYRGVSLVEVMVSIVLSAVALLALAGLNAATVRYTKMSQYRATAALLANDMGERMRANLAALTASSTSYNLVDDFDQQKADFAQQTSAVVLSSNDRCMLALSPPPGTSASCPSPPAALTGAQLAGLDLKHWRVLVNAQLPQGYAYIVNVPIDPADPTPARAIDLWIAWRDPELRSADEAPLRAASSAADPTVRNECPDGLNLDRTDPDQKNVRCSFFRINL